MDIQESYDGFTIIPDDENCNPKIIYFLLDEECRGGAPIDNSPLGDMFHVVLFKKKNNSECVFDETFEAIFIDPMFYAKRLLPNFYCTFIRKTDKSTPWFEEYLKELYQVVMIRNLKKYKESLMSIANN
jgi:hypothetical protein